MGKLIKRNQKTIFNEPKKEEKITIDKDQEVKKPSNLTVFTGGTKAKSKEEKQIDPERLEALKKWREEELKDYKVEIPKTDKKNPSYQEIASVLIAEDGFIMKSAIKLGISYGTINKLIKKNPKLRGIIQDSTEALLDLAESKLKDGILAGDKICILFCLKSRGRHRGWIEDGSGIDVLDQKPVTFNYSMILPENCRLITNEGVEIYKGENKVDEIKKESNGKT